MLVINFLLLWFFWLQKRITFEISIDPHFHSLLFKSFGLPSYSPQSRKIHTEAVGGGGGVESWSACAQMN